MIPIVGLVFVLLCICLHVQSHSGLYGVNTTLYSKDFSASFLMSKDRFIQTEDDIARALGMSSATFNVIRYPCTGCVNLVSRDFFDFMVEHLSSTTNQLPADVVPLFEKAISRMKNVAQILRSHEIPPEKDGRLDHTMAILVYSSNSFSKTVHKVQGTIRPAFFEVTFWSVYRYIKHVHIYVANEEDANKVEAMKLSYTSLVQLDTPLDHKNRTNMLPRDSMLHALRALRDPDDPLYNNYQYVFYSEGDQSLHIREAGVLYDAIDNSKGAFSVVPHRMQTQPVMQDYPPIFHHYWSKDTNQNLPHVEIAVESIHTAKGSCCNNGDIEVAKCGGGWWYQCKDWGLRNLTTWLKFGEYGFTMPPATEHKATSDYSAERVLCPQPKDCKTRYPKPRKGHETLSREDVCKEIVNTVLLGPVLEQQAEKRKEERKKVELKARAKELAFQRAVVEQLDEALDIDTMLMAKSDALWEQRMKELKQSGKLQLQDLEGEEEEQREDHLLQTEKQQLQWSNAPKVSASTSSDKKQSEVSALPKVANRTYGKDRPIPSSEPEHNTDINGDGADRAEDLGETGVTAGAVKTGSPDVNTEAAPVLEPPKVVGGSRKGKGGKGRRKKRAAGRPVEGEGDEGTTEEGEEGGRTRQKKGKGGGRKRNRGDGDSVTPKLDDIQ